MQLGMAGVAALAACAAFCAREACAAGAAYQVDTAVVSEPGSCKVESWVSAAANRDVFAAVSPACVVDLFRAVELSAQANALRAGGEWATGAVPKLKTNLVPGGGVGEWSLALTATAAYDGSAGEFTALTVTLPATLRMSENSRVNLNAGYLRDRAGGRDMFAYGVGVDLRTPDNVWTVTGEVFGVAGPARDEDDRGVLRPRWQLGLRWRPVDRFNVDLIWGRNLYGESANWITLATVVRFKPGR